MRSERGRGSAACLAIGATVVPFGCLIGLSTGGAGRTAALAALIALTVGLARLSVRVAGPLSPRMVWALRRRRGGPRGLERDRAHAVDPRGVEVEDDFTRFLAAMTDAELGATWRHSYFELDRCGSLTERLTVVMLRNGLLDEMVRRDEDGVRLWLRSAPEPSSNPASFISSTRGPESPRASD